MSNTIFILGAIIIKGDIPWLTICLLVAVGVVADIVSMMKLKLVRKQR
jgi:hypothetical protein